MVPLESVTKEEVETHSRGGTEGDFSLCSLAGAVLSPTTFPAAVQVDSGQDWASPTRGPLANSQGSLRLAAHWDLRLCFGFCLLVFGFSYSRKEFGDLGTRAIILKETSPRILI